MPLLSRRSMLKHATITGMALPLASVARLGRAAANDKLRLAGIGVGGMGGADLAALSSHPNVEVVAVCDVDAGKLAAAAEKHAAAKQFADFRRMFDECAGVIDAVHVSTPDHTHAPAAMTALNYGKHVYCQKPLTHDVHESRQLRAAAAANASLVTQMGTQIHSNTQYRTAVKLVQSGIIGKVREVYSWSGKTWGYDGPKPEPGAVPASLDWNLWLGTAADRSFCPGHYHPGNWRRWYDFGGGTMGDMAIHILDPVFSALQLGPPRSLLSNSSRPPADSFGMQNETRFTFPAGKYTTDGFVLTWFDGGKMPDTSAWPLDGVDGTRMTLPGQGSIFLGEKGAILLPHVAMPTLLPVKDFADAAIEVVPNGNHYHLFVDACLGGAPTTCGFDYAGPLTETVLLGTLANRFPGDEIRWQPAAMTIPNHDQADALLRRKYRTGFEVDNLS